MKGFSVKEKWELAARSLSLCPPRVLAAVCAQVAPSGLFCPKSAPDGIPMCQETSASWGNYSPPQTSSQEQALLLCCSPLSLLWSLPVFWAACQKPRVLAPPAPHWGQVWALAAPEEDVSPHTYPPPLSHPVDARGGGPVYSFGTWFLDPTGYASWYPDPLLEPKYQLGVLGALFCCHLGLDTYSPCMLRSLNVICPSTWAWGLTTVASLVWPPIPPESNYFWSCLNSLHPSGIVTFLKNIYLFRLHRVLVAAFGLIVAACMRDLVPRPGIEPRPPALWVRSLTHWTTREVPGHCDFIYLLTYPCNQPISPTLVPDPGPFPALFHPPPVAPPAWASGSDVDDNSVKGILRGWNNQAQRICLNGLMCKFQIGIEGTRPSSSL